MSTDDGNYSPATRDAGVTVASARFATFATRNLVFLLAVLAMNYTLMRPSPVDLLFIGSFLITLFHIILFANQDVRRRAITLTLLVGAWAVSYIVASLPHLSEPFVLFELIAKTFAISIAVVGAFVSMSWNGRHFETFMKVYIVSCVVASILGTIGFVTQMELLTWDGRAKGLIDDPNMYGSFLLPAAMFCAYFLFRPRNGKLLYLGALAIVLLGIILSFSRIAQVAVVLCLVAYVVFRNRRRPDRLLLMAAGLLGVGLLAGAAVALAPPEFSAKFLDRLTFAKSYDLGEEGRYGRYLLVLPMILQNPIGVGVLQLEKVFPEPIHNIWLSSFVNYGWLAGFAWISLVVSSVIVCIRNYRATGNDLALILMLSLVAILMCATLHEGEHWRHMWLMYGIVWGFNAHNLGATKTLTSPGRHAPRRTSGSGARFAVGIRARAIATRAAVKQASAPAAGVRGGIRPST
jgi:O-antigen ligase